MSGRGFEDLEVYNLSEKVADEIWELVRQWDNLARDTIGKQIVRAADSIGANIAEGFGRGTFQDVDVSSESLEGRFTKPATGCVVHSGVVSCRNLGYSL